MAAGDFRFQTIPTHTAVAVGTASITALAANPNREYALLINDSAVVMYLNLGGTAAANTGIRLAASGGSDEMTALHGNLYLGIVKVIAASGSGNNLLVLESADR